VRILVEVLHVRMGRRAVEVEVVLLHVLAVIAFAVGQPEEALLQDRIGSIPECQGEAETLLIVTDPRDAVLAPAVGARSRLIVTQVVPGVARLAIVLPDRAPLPFAQVGTPLLPRNAEIAGFLQAKVFGFLSLSHDVPPSTSARRGWITAWGLRDEGYGARRSRHSCLRTTGSRAEHPGPCVTSWG